jgi:hypothetical protein
MLVLVTIMSRGDRGIAKDRPRDCQGENQRAHANAIQTMECHCKTLLAQLKPRKPISITKKDVNDVAWLFKQSRSMLNGQS